MTSRDIFKIISKTVGLLTFCYGLIVGVFGSLFFYATAWALADVADGWIGVLSKGDVYLIIAFGITQGALPIGLGFLLMGTDIVPDYCFPKLFEKWLEPRNEDRRFEISKGAGEWRPPRF